MKRQFDPLDPWDVDDLDGLTEEQLADQERRLKQAEQDLRDIMSTPTGRRFMWRLFEKTGVYRTTFRANSEGAFLEGARAIGVAYLTECHALALEESITMMRENANDN